MESLEILRLRAEYWREVCEMYTRIESSSSWLEMRTARLEWQVAEQRVKECAGT